VVVNHDTFDFRKEKSDDKVVYLQKWQHDYVKEMEKRQQKNSRKEVPLFAPFTSIGHSQPLFFCDLRS